mgnify:CR=1 FL=1
MRTPALTLVAFVLPLAASADVVYLKSGGAFSGRIVSRSATTIDMDIGAGPGGDSHGERRARRGEPFPLQEFEDRAARIPADNGRGLARPGRLGGRARAGHPGPRGLQPRAERISRHTRANEAVGNVYRRRALGGRDEAYRARGYIKFEGQWMMPAEQEAILRERVAENAMEHQRREGEERAREGREARADEAEARARQAEADAEATAKAQDGIPVWYGWGAGPSVWPTGPIVVPRIAPAQPIGVVR